MNFDKYHFVYNAMAFFHSQERYPEGLAKELLKGGISGFEATCWALEELSTQGSLFKKSLGYEATEILTAEEAMARISPKEVMGAQLVVLEAVKRGMGVPDENEEVDEVLLEIQKKKE